MILVLWKCPLNRITKRYPFIMWHNWVIFHIPYTSQKNCKYSDGSHWPTHPPLPPPVTTLPSTHPTAVHTRKDRASSCWESVCSEMGLKCATIHVCFPVLTGGWVGSLMMSSVVQEVDASKVGWGNSQWLLKASYTPSWALYWARFPDPPLRGPGNSTLLFLASLEQTDKCFWHYHSHFVH